MKVTPISVPDSASDPAHPDHERWVKDRTLKMEMDHAKAAGLSTRAAEAENARLLERTAHIAAEQRPAKPKQKPNAGHSERNKQRGVIKRAAAPEKPAPKRCQCGACGTCKRAHRIVQIMQMGRENTVLMGLAQKLMVASLQASAGTGTFLGLNKKDRERRLNACVDEACDASVRVLGAWR